MYTSITAIIIFAQPLAKIHKTKCQKLLGCRVFIFVFVVLKAIAAVLLSVCSADGQMSKNYDMYDMMA